MAAVLFRFVVACGTLVGWGAAGGFAVAGLAGGEPNSDEVSAAERARPNIVLVMVDDLGKEWVSCYGAKDIETPQLDAMARGGMRFNHVYSMPQCTPTRLTLLTGQYPYRHGWVNHWDVPRWGAGCHFDPGQYPAVLGTEMRRLGYATAIAGKWQIDDFRVEPRALDEAGFDQWCVWTGGEAGNRPSDERYWDPYVFRHDSPAATRAGQFGPDLFHRFVLDFIAEPREQPFFVYYPMALVHPPLVATPDEPEARGRLPRHKAMVRYMDRLMGEMVAQLESLGLAEDTIILWTTDNGTSAGIDGTMVVQHEDGERIRKVPGGKSKTLESGVNSPLIAYGPGRVPAGVVSEALVDFSDFLPTLVELGGGALAESAVDGRSFAKVLRGDQDASPRDWILAMGGQNRAQVTEAGVQNEWVFRDRVMRNERFKVYIDSQRQIVRLIDLIADPEEAGNLLDDPPTETVPWLRKVRAAIESMPKEDADPRYRPNPPQAWDRPVTRKAGVWKKG